MLKRILAKRKAAKKTRPKEATPPQSDGTELSEKDLDRVAGGVGVTSTDLLVRPKLPTRIPQCM